MSIFTPADILIPQDEMLEKWSVIACDQFSSEREYWDRVRAFAGDAPSALHMIIPEAYLSQIDETKQIQQISAAMENYLNSSIFRRIDDSFILTLRTQPDGRVRKGLIGTIDLEEYDFTGRQAAIRASEGTVLARLPVRRNIRAAASLELPHVIVFIDDKDNTVIEPLAAKTGTLNKLYEFTLMEGGGRIKGYQVTGGDAAAVNEAMQTLDEKCGGSPLMIVGDGNHSLAGAKVYWDGIKQNLGQSQRETHPARRALVEVCNVYDPAIDFEAIHRALFNIDAEEFIKEMKETVPQGDDYVLRRVIKEKSFDIGIKAACIGDMLEAVQSCIDNYLSKHSNAGIDYIHGEEALCKLAQGGDCLGLLLPAMDKSELFQTVALRGVFPRKSFSVGHARDKRYYLECRRITAANRLSGHFSERGAE